MTVLSDDLVAVIDAATKPKPHAFVLSKPGSSTCKTCGKTKAAGMHIDKKDDGKGGSKPPWMKGEQEFTPPVLAQAHGIVLGELAEALDRGDVSTARVLLISARATFDELARFVEPAGD